MSRQFFGKTECPETADAEMYLWLVYSCDDGGTDKTTTHRPACDASSAQLTSTPTIPTIHYDQAWTQPTPSSPTPSRRKPPETESCTHDDEVEKVQVDVPGCDGSLDIVCDRGCIAVHKVP